MKSASSIVFSDDFDNGRKPEWKVCSGAWSDVVAGRVDVLTDTQAIELDWLKGNKFHEGIGQALHYGDVTGQQPVLALISAYYNIFGAEQQKLEYVSGLCAAHGVEVWALTTRRQ
mgnify:CR=1 FL=1